MSPTLEPAGDFVLLHESWILQISRSFDHEFLVNLDDFLN